MEEQWKEAKGPGEGEWKRLSNGNRNTGLSKQVHVLGTSSNDVNDVDVQ